jgi:4-amino-4-deoxy-L-arabinose transferase-like glycosyltransferase
MRFALWLILGLGLVLRVTNLGLFPAFVDESSALFAAKDYTAHPVMERIFLGKYLGYLAQRPVVEFARDPLWAGRALSAIFGIMAAGLATGTIRRLAGLRAALVGAVLLSLNPQLVFHDRLALPESLAVLLVAVTCWLWALGHERRRMEFLWLAGAAAACACATKVYTAPVLLLLPMAAAGTLGGVVSFFRRDGPALAAGFLAAGLLLFFSALDPSWNRHFSLADLLAIPKTIVGSSAATPSLGTRLVTAAGLLAAFLPVSTYVLLISLLAGNSLHRRRAIGCLLVALGGFVLYAIVFRSFVASRYFNALWLPAAFCAGFAAGPVAPGENGPGRRLTKFLRVLQFVLLGIVALQFTRRDATLLTNPETFPLPESDRYQYLTGWPSGRGLKEVADYFRDRSLRSARPVLVFTLMGFRHGSMTLPLLLRDSPSIRFMPAWEGSESTLQALPSLAAANTVLVLVEPMGSPLDFTRVASGGFILDQVFTGPPMVGSAHGYQVFEIKLPAPSSGQIHS